MELRGVRQGTLGSTAAATKAVLFFVARPSLIVAFIFAIPTFCDHLCVCCMPGVIMARGRLNPGLEVGPWVKMPTLVLNFWSILSGSALDKARLGGGRKAYGLGGSAGPSIRARSPRPEGSWCYR